MAAPAAAFPTECDVLIIGGGIAGVSCAEEVRRLAPNARVLLVSASRSLVGVRSVVKVTLTIEELDVVERPLDFLEAKSEGGSGSGWVKARFGTVACIGVKERTATLANGAVVRFAKACCVCTGATPRSLDLRRADGADAELPAALRPHVIRDSPSVAALASSVVAAAVRRARSSQAPAAAAAAGGGGARRPARVLLVGNGPIACELAVALRSLASVSWCLRDGYVGRTLLDASASRFFVEEGAAGAALTEGPSDAEHAFGACGDQADGPGSVGAPPRCPSGSECGSAGPEGAAEGGSGFFANALGPRWVDALRSQVAAGLAANAATAGAAAANAAEPVAPAAAGAEGREGEASTGGRLTGGATRAARGQGASGEPTPPVGHLRLMRGAEVVACRAREGSAGWSAWWSVAADCELVTPAEQGDDQRGRPEDWEAACSSSSEADADAAFVAVVRVPGLSSAGGSFVAVAADVLVAATGVSPCVGMCPPELARGADGGLAVTRRMEARGGGGVVFAAGDAASIDWGLGGVGRRTETSIGGGSHSAATAPGGAEDCDDDDVDVGGEHWFPMRLWTQGRVTGAYAGARIACGAMTTAERGAPGLTELELEGGFNLDLFAHCTSLAGFKVVLLGRFNGQGLGEEYEEAVRALAAPTLEATASAAEGAPEAAATAGAPAAGEDGGEGGAQAGVTVRKVGRAGSDRCAVGVQVSWLPGHHYMKLVLLRGRVVGAVLVGDTDMEEAAERLIQGGHQLGDVDLTDPSVDIDGVLD
ncbi:hypothetical protein FNF28_00328 [Cafeteria roenbergensis]|uniref:FAD/NAD(P)-binding domain-containing protein n=1 Tax=Cafeteria roenbergensis TaxID=33653 RepID=A0A5A8E800_CAFRO|nr:hypothetical protein FNF28_00328 [Cafeteria roenbergensis]